MEATVEKVMRMFRIVGFGVLGILVLLASPPRPAGAADSPLNVLELPDKSLFQTAVVEVSANTDTLTPCSKARLSLLDSKSSELIEVEPGFRNCSDEGGVLKAIASISRKAIEGRQVDAKLEICGTPEDCKVYRGRLPDSAQPVKLRSIIFKGIEGSKLLFEASATLGEIDLEGRIRTMYWEPLATQPLADPEIGLGDGANRLSIRVPLECSEAESIGTEFSRVVFAARGREGGPEGFAYEGVLPLCPSPRHWNLWIGGGVGLIVLALTGWLVGSPKTRARVIGLFRRGGDRDSPPSWFDASLQDLVTKIESGFRDVKEELGQLRSGKDSPLGGLGSQRYGPEQGSLEKIEEDNPYSPEAGTPDSSLLQVVNEWWSDGSGDKEALVCRISKHGLKLYESLDTDGTLQNMVARTYSFQPSSGPAGWVWQPLSKNEALAVPADRFLFHAGNMIEIIKLLFDGVGEAPKNFRFYKASKPCRLRADSVGSNRYRLMEKGYLELADRFGSRIPGPASTATPSSSRTPAPSPSPNPRRPDTASSPALGAKIEELLRAIADLGKGLKDLQSQRRDEITCEVTLPPDLIRSQRRLEDLPEILKKLDGIQSALSELVTRVDRLEDRPAQMSLVPSPEPEAVSSPGVPRSLPETAKENPMMLSTDEEDIPARLGSPPEPILSSGLPEPVRPASRFEIDPPTSQASPEEFQLRLLRDLPGLQAVGSEPPGRPVPSDYLERLVALRKRLIQEQSKPVWDVVLVHLHVTRPAGQKPFFAVHRIEKIRDDLREAYCRTCGAISEYFLYQVFLLLHDKQGDLSGVAMVHSTLADQFADGYSLLTRQGTPRVNGSVGMVRPAVLQRIAGSNEAWHVALPMEVVFQ